MNNFTEKDLKQYVKDYQVRNINFKMKHGEWLYNDLPNGRMIKQFRIIASGNPDDVGKLVDSFGREYDVPRKGN